MDEYYRLAQCLPQPYAAELAALPIRCAPYVQEIRLRAGQSMLFTVNGRVSPAAKYLPRADRLRRLTAKEVQDCFQHLCRDSVFAYEEELRQGFFTIRGRRRAAAQRLAGLSGTAGAGGIVYADTITLSFVQPGLFRCRHRRTGRRAKAVRTAVPFVCRGRGAVRLGAGALLFPRVFIHGAFTAYRKWGVKMAAVRSAAFGCCVLSTVAGLVRIFWPENGFKPVINAVLALYIITAAVQIIRVADWAGIAAELAPASDSSSVSDSEVGAYRRTLTDEAAAQALRDVLAASGIEAAITRTDTGWQVTLVHAADGQKAEALLAANCGTIPYEITAGGTAP